MTSSRSRLRITRNLPPSPPRLTGMKRAYALAVLAAAALSLAGCAASTTGTAPDPASASAASAAASQSSAAAAQSAIASEVASQSAAANAPCTTRACIVSDAKQLVGGVAKDDSVMTAMSCRKSTVKRATAGVWTVHCTATYSDDEKVTGIASVLLAKEQVTWEPTGTVSGG